MQEVARANLVRASLILADTSSPISGSMPPSISATNAQSTPISTPRVNGDENNHTHTQSQSHTQTYNDHPPHTPQKLQISKYAPQRPDEPTPVPTPVTHLGKGAAHLINGLVGGAGRSISKVGASIIGGDKPVGLGIKTDNINNKNGHNGNNSHSQPQSPVMRTTGAGNGTGTGQMKMTPNDNNNHNNNNQNSANLNSAPQRRSSHNMTSPQAVSTNRNNNTDSHEGSSTVSTATKISTLPPGVVMRSTAVHRTDGSTSAPPSPPKPDSMINKFSSFFGGGK